MMQKSKLLHQPEPEKSRHLKLGPVELRAWRPSAHGLAEGVVLYVLKDAKCITCASRGDVYAGDRLARDPRHPSFVGSRSTDARRGVHDPTERTLVYPS